MKYQDVIYDENEYKQFGKMLIDSAPQLDDMLEDQDVINMYNQIKEKAPQITLQDLSMMLPQIVSQIFSKLKGAPQEGIADKLAALQGMRR